MSPYQARFLGWVLFSSSKLGWVGRSVLGTVLWFSVQAFRITSVGLYQAWLCDSRFSPSESGWRVCIRHGFEILSWTRFPQRQPRTACCLWYLPLAGLRCQGRHTQAPGRTAVPFPPDQQTTEVVGEAGGAETRRPVNCGLTASWRIWVTPLLSACVDLSLFLNSRQKSREAVKATAACCSPHWWSPSR